MPLTVKALADLASVTVRTLHHYDRIGLLRPTAVSPAGYRLYERADLERLQQVLFFRELGFTLEEVKRILDSSSFDRREAMRSHRALLLEKQRRIARLIASADETLDAMERGAPMSDDALFDPFDDAQIERYREEARQRWGSERVDESYRRLGRLSREEQEELFADGRARERALAQLMDRDPADPEVQSLIEQHHRSIVENFYPCPPAMYRGLGDLWVSDARFTAHFTAVRPGLAAFMRDAVHVYANRLEAEER